MLTVTVIIPVYNDELYLKECVDSVLSQTYTNLQILLINDGSTDSSCRLCDEYGLIDSRVEVVHQANAGVSAARNNGILRSKGDIILFIDCDDIICKDMVQTLVDTFILTKADLVITPLSRSRDALQLSDPKVKDSIVIYDFGNIADDIFAKLVTRELISGVPGKAYTRSIIDGTVFNIEQFWGEDLCFNAEILEKKPIVTVCEKSKYFYRMVDNSLSTKFQSRKYDCFIITYKKLLDLLDVLVKDGKYSMEAYERRIAADWVWWIEQIKNAPIKCHTYELIRYTRLYQDNKRLMKYIRRGIRVVKTKLYIKALILMDNSLLWKYYITLSRKRK